MVKTPASNAGCTGSIPGWATKIPHATALPKQKNKNRKQTNKKTQMGEVSDYFQNLF